MSSRPLSHKVAATLALVALSGACSKEPSGALPSVDPLSWMKGFPRLQAALGDMRYERERRTAPPTPKDAARHGQLIVGALLADLQGQEELLGANQLSEHPNPTDVIRAFNGFLVKHEQQCFLMSPDSMEYQILQLRRAGALEASDYSFGPFGHLEEPIPVHEVTAVVYDITGRGESFLAGSFLDLGREEPIVVIEPRVFTEFADVGISFAEARKKTLDNEAGHARFREYLERHYPALAHPTDKLAGPTLQLHEAFSFYSNLCHTPARPLLLDIMEKLAQSLEGSLYPQYRTLSLFLMQGLNTHLGRPPSTPSGEFEAHPRDYQQLLAPMLAEPNRLEPLREQLKRTFENEILRGLDLLMRAPK